MCRYCTGWAKKSRKNVLICKEKDPLPAIQCTAAHLFSFDGQNYGIKIRIITTSNVFTVFGPQWLLLFPNLENGSVDNVSLRTRRSSSKQMPILRTFRNPSFWTAEKVGETLGKVYRVKRRLCWKIKKNPHKITCFYIFF